MGYMAEFKKFALKGNVMDMAVGIIIGAAFGKVVSSLVKDIIMPPDRCFDRRCQFFPAQMGDTAGYRRFTGSGDYLRSFPANDHRFSDYQPVDFCGCESHQQHAAQRRRKTGRATRTQRIRKTAD